jgi:hypothetical protein
MRELLPAMILPTVRTRICIGLLSLALVACESRPAARDAERGDGEQTRVASDSAPARRGPSVYSTPEPVPYTLDDASRGAEEVVRAYYGAINDRDYERAYAAWGADRPPGRPTLHAFASGFAGTDPVHVVLGAPGRIEGAAGSRYIRIPVRVRAFEHGIGPREYLGSYTVRRSVIPGSDAANRRWHLYSANLH